MSRRFETSIDLNKNELLNGVIHVLGSDPISPTLGQIYFNSSSNLLRTYNGSSWNEYSPGGNTNLSFSRDGTTVTVESDTGTNAILPAATGALAGVLTAADKTKLDGITGTNTGDQTITLTGEVTGSGTGSFATTIANNAVTYAKLQASTVGYTVLGKSTTGVGNFAQIVAGTDSVLRRSGSGDLAFGTLVTNNLGNSIVTLAKMANVATGTIFYRKTAGSGAPEVQTLATLKTDLGLTGTNTGDQTITLTGDVTGSGTGSFATTIANGVIDWGMLNQAWIITQAEGISSNDNDTTIPTSAAVKDYVDNAITAGMAYKGGYNAATNTPALDTGSPSIVIGDTYTVTAAGTFFTEDVQIGDVIIAQVTSSDAASLSDWTILNKNIPDIVSASETEEGIIELATQAEVNTGTDTTRAVTPATLQSKLGVTASLNSTVRYTQQIGNGSSTTIVVTHNIGRQFVTAQVFETSSPFAQIECDIELDSANATSFTFNTAPASNEFTVVIVG